MGRGLSSLLSPHNSRNDNLGDKTFKLINISSIEASAQQPRKNFVKEELENLSASIKSEGVLQPILVREKNKDLFEIIAGERRWRAAQIAGIHQIPAVIKQMNDDEAMQAALIENIQREDLNPIEEARAYKTILESDGINYDNLSNAIGKSKSHISNTIRLLELDIKILNYIENGKISMGHARALIGVPNAIDLAEDRKKFGAILDKLDIPKPEYGTALSEEEAVNVTTKIGYPVLVRPSYVLGGRAMEIVYNDQQLLDYVRKAADVSPEHPILIDSFLEDAFEFDVDALCDEKQVYIAGVMQHIEEAGIHSGDSSCVLPPYWLTDSGLKKIEEYTRQITLELGVQGLINIQFAEKGGTVYVLEANPRASRTVPFVSKATDVPLAKIATGIALGKTLSDYKLSEFSTNGHIAVKKPVFPFNKFPEENVFLGPEMKSTGEVMGVAPRFGDAFAKAITGDGQSLPTSGKAFVSVNDNDKMKVLPIVRDMAELGFEVVATEGTAKTCRRNGIRTEKIFKVGEGRPNAVDGIKNGEIQLVINTPLGAQSRYDEYAIGRAAIQARIPVVTTLSGAQAAVRAIRSKNRNEVRPLQEIHGK